MADHRQKVNIFAFGVWGLILAISIGSEPNRQNYWVEENETDSKQLFPPHSGSQFGMRIKRFEDIGSFYGRTPRGHAILAPHLLRFDLYGTVSAKIAPRLKCYKNASRLNRYNFPTDNAIDFLFSTLDSEMVQYEVLKIGSR